MKNLIYTLFLLLAGASLAACNTTRGLGEDVEAAGEEVQDIAENTEEQIEEI